MSWLKLEGSRRQVAVAGRVIDAETEKAVARALVEIAEAPPEFRAWLALKAIRYGERWANMAVRPDRIRTAADGHFHFLDLPAGGYTLIASLPAAGSRYGTAEESAEVEHDPDGKISRQTVELRLPPTGLKGTITFSPQNGDAVPVVMAEVRIPGSGERTWSKGGGSYLLSALEVRSQCNVRVSTRDYGSLARNVDLSRGTVSIVNFEFMEGS